MVFRAAADSIEYTSINDWKFVANKAPKKGNTNHAKTPCTNQKFSQDHSLTLLMGTYELDWPKLPIAIMIKPSNVFIV